MSHASSTTNNVSISTLPFDINWIAYSQIYTHPHTHTLTWKYIKTLAMSNKVVHRCDRISKMNIEYFKCGMQPTPNIFQKEASDFSHENCTFWFCMPLNDTWRNMSKHFSYLIPFLYMYMTHKLKWMLFGIQFTNSFNIVVCFLWKWIRNVRRRKKWREE